MSKNRKYFSVVSLGCRVNRAEIDDFSAFLISQGWKITKIFDADLVIVNTCTVTHVADKKTRKTIRRVCNQAGKNTQILVTGCACAIDSCYYENFDPRIDIVPKHKVKAYLHKLAQNEDLLKSVDHKLEAEILSSTDFRTRAAIKIQDGCDNACTFCIVHVARGKSVSINLHDIEKRFEALIDAGVKEVVLTGVNLGAYNFNGEDIAKLSERLVKIIDRKFYKHNHTSNLNKNKSSKIDEVKTSKLANSQIKIPARIRLSSIEPQNVSDSLIDVMTTSCGKICRFLHLPLQSGSTKILREMNRHYSAEEYLELVNKLRKRMPNIALSTDIIVGFPGETDKDFEQTCIVAEKCKFMKIHVFPYSLRKGTPAATRKDQICDSVKANRAETLRKLSDKLAANNLYKHLELSEYALIESRDVARLESFHVVPAPENAEIGSLYQLGRKQY